MGRREILSSSFAVPGSGGAGEVFIGSWSRRNGDVPDPCCWRRREELHRIRPARCIIFDFSCIKESIDQSYRLTTLGKRTFNSSGHESIIPQPRSSASQVPRDFHRIRGGTDFLLPTHGWQKFLRPIENFKILSYSIH